MMITSNLLIVLALSVTAATFTDNYAHTLYVNKNGSNNGSLCWTGKIPCNSINLALNGMKSNSTVLYLYSGNYSLKQNDTQFSYRSDIAFIGLGNNSESVIINCDYMTGLSFLWSEYITLASLTLHGCGSVKVGSNRNLTSQSFLTFKVAVYVLFCKNVNISGVYIDSSSGTGMALYNTVGTVVIANSTFVRNGRSMKNSTCGGGGLLIQFTYCIPKNNGSCYHVNPEYVSYAEYSIVSTHLLSNVANYNSSLLYKLSNQHGDVDLCGRGGGLLLAFHGNSSNNCISFQDVTFQNNRAHQGAGMFLAFFDTVYNNSIVVASMNASNNDFHDTDRWTTDGGGGALKIEFSGAVHRNNISLSSINIFKNKASVGGGIFVSAICERNMELYKNLFCINLLTVVNGTFADNVADVGAAAYFSQRHTCIQVVYISITYSTFSSNSLTCNSKAFSFATRACSSVVYISSISIYWSGKLTFCNNTASAIEVHDTSVNFLTPTVAIFSNNSGRDGAAIALFDCSVVLLNPQVTLIFKNNNADSQGGAIYSGLCHNNMQPTSRSSQCFIQYSDEEVHPDKWNTSLIFNNNKPNSLYVNGAITCWWPMLNSSIITHDAIKNTFCWSGWSYKSGNCAANVRTSPALLNTTSSQNHPFTLYPGEGILLPVKVFDGQQNVITYSDLKMDVCIKSGPCAFNDVWNSTSEMIPQRCRSFILDEKVTMYSIAKNCSTIFKDLIHLSIVLGNLHADVVLRFKACPSNFLPKSNSDFCMSGDCFFTKCTWKFTDEITCDDSSRDCDNDKKVDCGIASNIYAQAGHCFSRYNDQNNKTHLIVGQCPILYGAQNFSVNYSSIQSVIDSNYKFCVNTIGKSVYGNALSHHTGRLCGDCVDGTGVPINSIYLQCIDCTESLGHVPGWILFIFLELFPMTVMVSVIIVLNVKLTGGSIGGYVFFSQLMSLSFAGHVYPIQRSDVSDHINEFSSGISWNTIFIPYHLWNLNFLPLLLYDGVPVCITNSMKPLGAITFWYVVAFYPILMLLLLYVWIYMYDNGYRLVGAATRPIHRVLARLWQMLNITPSLMDSIASIYILCVTQFTSISLKLLHFTSWKSLDKVDTGGLAFYYDGSLDYFGWKHGSVATFGILVLIFLVFLPMLYLLFHPFKWCQCLLNRLRLRREIVTNLSDIFTGALKNGSDNSRDYRYFAGLYLYLRVHIVCMYYIPYSKEDVLLFVLLSTSVVFGGMVTIFRPFKKNIDNFSNFLLFMIMAILSFSSNNLVSKYSVAKLVNICTLIVTLLPLCFAFFFCIYWIFLKFRFCIKYHVDHRAQSVGAIDSEIMREENEASDYNSTDFYPDRLLNPQNYKEKHYQYTHVTPALSTCETNVTEASTGTYTPLLETINDTSSYGSIND